jgi:uncharacterized protein YdeI (YjbR/CyaY-like superfamily)
MEKVPSDLQKALGAAPKAKAQWESLTPIARRDFISWIESAKQSETRERRVKVACSKLADGKRRPCCYAIVPMNLYKALGAAPKAKAQWSGLTADERRDFADWVESPKELKLRELRVEKVCMMLASGKRHP